MDPFQVLDRIAEFPLIRFSHAKKIVAIGDRDGNAAVPNMVNLRNLCYNVFPEHTIITQHDVNTINNL